VSRERKERKRGREKRQERQSSLGWHSAEKRNIAPRCFAWAMEYFGPLDDENTGMFMYSNVEHMKKILSELGRICDKIINTIRYPPAK
jgi:hypothetical protein